MTTDPNQTVRCKFRCNAVSKRLDTGYQKPGQEKFLYTYEFSAVYDGSDENKRFFAYTPSGNLNVGSFKDDLFEPGKEYYLDLTLAIPKVKPDEPMPDEIE